MQAPEPYIPVHFTMLTRHHSNTDVPFASLKVKDHPTSKKMFVAITPTDVYVFIIPYIFSQQNSQCQRMATKFVFYQSNLPSILNVKFLDLAFVTGMLL